MTISYIITTHNRPAQLEKAVASIAAERCVESELIIVDDKSQPPAAMPALAAAAFPGAHFLLRNAENLGVIGARNVGVFAARGKYLLFLDDDDESLPNRTRDLLAAIENSDFDFVAARSLMWTGASEKTVPTVGGFLLTPRQLLLNPSHIDAVLWRREKLVASAGLDGRVPYLGEHVTMMLWLLQDGKAWLSDAVVARFGYHDEGLTLQAHAQNALKNHLLAFYEVLLEESDEPAFCQFCRQVVQMLQRETIHTFDDYLRQLATTVRGISH